MARYTTFTLCGDFGSFISKLILPLPQEVGFAEVMPDAFNVFVSDTISETGDAAGIAVSSEAGAVRSGYLSVTRAYPSDEKGARLERGTYVTLEVPEDPLGMHLIDQIVKTSHLDNHIRVTQLRPFSGVDGQVAGLVWDELDHDICPQTEGWTTGTITLTPEQATAAEAAEAAKAAQAGTPQTPVARTLGYGLFTPNLDLLAHPAPDAFGNVPAPITGRLPLVIFLHGAGQGGTDPMVAVTGTFTTGLSGERIQHDLGGGAYVLVPQAPTYWMDDGVEQMGSSNRSIYVPVLKALIDQVVAENPRIDPDRIIISGLSNGGFMTERMLIDYPRFFAAGIAMCGPLFAQNQTSAVISSLAQENLWLVHAKNDELVDPTKTVLPLYRNLTAAQAQNVHLTYLVHVEDFTGVYKDDRGRPRPFMNHGVWVATFNDMIMTDVDGTLVTSEGVPVTCWEWAGLQRRGVVGAGR